MSAPALRVPHVSRLLILLGALAAVLAMSPAAHALPATDNWVGGDGATPNAWSDPGNWSSGVPADGTDVVIAPSGDDPTFDTSATATSLDGLRVESGATLTIAAGAPTLTAATSTGTQFSGSVIDDGELDLVYGTSDPVSGGGTMTVGPTGVFKIGGAAGAIVGNGINVDNGGTIEATTGTSSIEDLLSNTGTVQVDGGADLSFGNVNTSVLNTGTGTLQEGTLVVDGELDLPSVITDDEASITLGALGEIDSGGAMDNSALSTLGYIGGTRASSLTLNGTALTDSASVFVGGQGGALVLNSGAHLIDTDTVDPFVVSNGSDGLTLGDGAELDAPAISSSGLIAVTAVAAPAIVKTDSFTVGGPSPMTIASGAALTLQTSAGDTGTLDLTGGSLGGTGTLTGDVDLSGTGLVEPGTSIQGGPVTPGTLTVDGDLDQTGGSVQIAAIDSGPSKLVVSGTATLTDTGTTIADQQLDNTTPNADNQGHETLPYAAYASDPSVITAGTLATGGDYAPVVATDPGSITMGRQESGAKFVSTTSATKVALTLVEVTPPSAPTAPVPSRPASTPSNTTSVTESFTAGTDDTNGSGLLGTCAEFSTSATAPTAAALCSASPASSSASKSSGTLNDGTYYFYAASEDESGKFSTVLTDGPFLVDTTAPAAPSITGGPVAGSSQTATDASFTFTDEANATFQCKLDSASYATCASPQAYSGLSVGQHTFSVEATDAADNTGAAASVTFTVASPAPPAAPTCGAAQTLTTNENTAGSILETCSGGDTYTASGASHGTVTKPDANNPGSPSFTYTPQAGYAGTDQFTITATDAFNQSASEVVNVVVAPTPTAPAVAPPPAGLPAADLGTPVSVTIQAGVAGSTVTPTPTGSALVTIPAGALPAGTTVSTYPVDTDTALAGTVPPSSSYVLAFSITWVAPDGTSPNATAPLTLTVHNPGVVAGDRIYMVTPTGLKQVGTATGNGTVTVSFTSDPTFVLAASPKLSVVGAGVVKPSLIDFTLTCRKNTKCLGAGSITTTVVVKKHGKNVRTTVVLASGSVRLVHGAKKLIAFHLTKAGRAYLALHKGKKIASVITLKVAAGITTTQKTTIR